ncbi:MAG TPA: PorV/PorQ family protein [archaeon]|nr:PorV/PorQ family protein [archaeon]
MLSKKVARVLLTVCAFLTFVTGQAMAQGVARQDYSGLDKYLVQGRQPNSSFVGVRAAEFLTIPVGARGIAMGSSFASVADDITAVWWNPAGLGFLEDKEVMFTVVDYTLDLTYSYGAVAFPIADGKIVVGGFFGYLDIPDMEITTVSSPDGTGSYFSAYDFQLGGSLAYNLSDRFVAGLNVKYVHQDMWSNMGGSALAVDAGAIYHTDFLDREIKFAFAIQNLGTNITMEGPTLLYEVGPQDRSGSFPQGYDNFSNPPGTASGENTLPYAISRRSSRQVYMRTHTYRLPTIVKISMAYNLYTSDKANWLASGEIWRNSNIPISYATGTELTYNFNPNITASLRAGWQIQTDEYSDNTDAFGYTYWGDDPTFRGLSFGGGVKRVFFGRFIDFSYAYRNKGRLSADNFFTITFGF